ncbi:MAG: hypothetical protein KAW12_08310 [Candidatus Aminicenantes bacterium]|nr:hypothetical protein [Candidatus Aminicenantes bacterium]
MKDLLFVLFIVLFLIVVFFLIAILPQSNDTNFQIPSRSGITNLGIENNAGNGLKKDFDKEEVYRYIERVYAKHMDIIGNFFIVVEIILVAIVILLTVFGWLNYRSYHKDREFLENLIKDRINSYTDGISTKLSKLENEFKSKIDDISKFERDIKGFSKEIERLRKDALWAEESQSYYAKLRSDNPEEIIDGLTKITDKLYYNPPIYRKIEELSGSKNNLIKIAALKALAAFGDSSSLKKLTKLAKKNEDAQTTLKHFKEEYPYLFND